MSIQEEDYKLFKPDVKTLKFVHRMIISNGSADRSSIIHQLTKMIFEMDGVLPTMNKTNNPFEAWQGVEEYRKTHGGELPPKGKK